MKEKKELTLREVDVLNELLHTSDNYEIGEKLAISHHTVHSHKKNIYRKLEVHDRSDAVIQGIKLGYIKLD